MQGLAGDVARLRARQEAHGSGDVVGRAEPAGQGAADAVVVRELPDPVGTEFAIVADELTYGLDLETAMKNMNRRVGQQDLGLLVVDQGQVLSGGLLNALLLLNPTDAYRLFNLTGSGNVSAFSGMAGVAQTTTLSPSVLLAALAAWALLPLGLAAFAFSRREL